MLCATRQCLLKHYSYKYEIIEIVHYVFFRNIVLIYKHYKQYEHGLVFLSSHFYTYDDV